MNKISNYFYAKAFGWLTLGLTAVMFAYPFLVLRPFSACYHMNGGPNSFGLSFGYSMQDVLEFFSIRSPDMIECFIRSILIWDNIFPVLYGLTHVFLISYFFKAYQNNLRSINLFPVIQVILDWFENANVVQMAHSYLKSGIIDDQAVQMGSALTAAKWSVYVVVIFVILIGIVLKIKSVYANR